MKNCIIGAGALVTAGKNFPEGSLVMGSPAQIIRPLTTDEIKNVKTGVEHYLDAKDELLKNV
jgi:carbonic anhydrase/acetyltransferase-like protein (isoleucine patch superfamily)